MPAWHPSLTSECPKHATRPHRLYSMMPAWHPSLTAECPKHATRPRHLPYDACVASIAHSGVSQGWICGVGLLRIDCFVGCCFGFVFLVNARRDLALADWV